MTRENKSGNHSFFYSRVAAGTAVIIGGAYILPELTGGIIDGIIQFVNPGYTAGLSMAILSLVYLLFFTRWFKPEFKGISGTEGLKEGFYLLIPYAAVIICGIAELIFAGESDGIKYSYFALAVMAGVCEEIAFRGAPGAYLMRMVKDENSIMKYALILSAVFGLVHFQNLYAASLIVTVYQAAAAFCIGMCFAAVFFRTGCIWPVIIAHFTNDFIAFFDVSRVQDGVIQGSELAVSDYIDLVLCIGLMIYGIYLLRPEKRGDILKLWRNKWSLATEEEKTDGQL